MSFASIAIKTSIPGTVPAATSGAITLSTIEDENWLQIIGDASAGSGSLYLLRWNPDLSVWHPYMKDKPIAVDSSAFDGLFSAYYPFPKGDESFVLYDPTGTITATASAARTGSPLVAPTPASGGAMSGGATEAKQDTGNTSLSSIDGKVATAANQTTANASLSSIDTKLSAFSSGTSTISSVNCTSAANLFASNSSAKSRWIYNPVGNGTLWVRLGSGSHTGVSTSTFFVEGGQFVRVYPLDFTGQVQGLLAAGSQTIQATEVA